MKQLRRLLNPKFSVRRSISLPVEIVWPILVDTQFWPEWGLSILSVTPNSQVIHCGMRGQVRTIFGFDLPYVLFPYSIVCLIALRRIAQLAIRLR